MARSRTPFKRCQRCVFFDKNIYSGTETCTRNYPPVSDFEDDCKIRLWKKGPKVSAYKPRPEFRLDMDILFGKEVTPMSESTLADRKKAAMAAMNKYRKAVEEKKGSGIVVDFGDKLPEQYQGFKRLSLPVASLNKFLGGGLPLGGLITLGGKESSGKSTTALTFAAAAQAADKLVAYADVENTLTMEWAAKNGVNTQDLLVLASGVPKNEAITPTALEDYLNAIIQLINGSFVDMIIIDSLDAMIARGRMKAKKGKTRDLDDADMALKARVLSDFYPRILGACRDRSIAVVQIGQLRATGIGTAFVSLQVGGGNARKYYDLLTLHLRRGEKKNAPLGEDGQPVGFEYVLSAKKSKVSGIQEGSEMSTSFFFNMGFNPMYEMTVEALDREIIRKKGNANALFITEDGTELKIPFGKASKISDWIEDTGVFYEVRQQLTGEVIPDGYSYQDILNSLADSEEVKSEKEEAA